MRLSENSNQSLNRRPFGCGGCFKPLWIACLSEAHNTDWLAQHSLLHRVSEKVELTLGKSVYGEATIVRLAPIFF